MHLDVLMKEKEGRRRGETLILMNILTMEVINGRSS